MPFSNENSLIEGLPPDAVVASRELERLIERGVYRLLARPGYREGLFVIECHPLSEKAVPYVPRHRKPDAVSYCLDDARMTVVDPGSDISFQFPGEPEEGDVTFDGLPDEDVIYRGMCSEEFESIREAGEVKSQGGWNLKGQDGLTYWTTSPASAASYANAFAPMHCRPTFGHDAYIVAAKRPEKTVVIRGTGSDEVGVPDGIAAEDIVAAWRGKVFDFNPGQIDLVNENGVWRTGGMAQLSARVAWEKIDGLTLENALGIAQGIGYRSL